MDVGIWGFHDRRLTLRKALCCTLSDGAVKDAFRRRWRYHQSQINKQVFCLFLCANCFTAELMDFQLACVLEVSHCIQ